MLLLFCVEGDKVRCKLEMFVRLPFVKVKMYVYWPNALPHEEYFKSVVKYMSEIDIETARRWHLTVFNAGVTWG